MVWAQVELTTVPLVSGFRTVAGLSTSAFVPEGLHDLVYALHLSEALEWRHSFLVLVYNPYYVASFTGRRRCVHLPMSGG